MIKHLGLGIEAKKQILDQPDFPSLGTSLFRTASGSPHEEVNLMLPEIQIAKIEILESKTRSIEQSLKDINGRITDVKEILENRTLSTNSISWRLLIIVSGGLVTIALSFVTVFTWYHNGRIDEARNDGIKIESKMEARLNNIDSKVDDGIANLRDELNKRLDALRTETKELLKLVLDKPEEVVTTTKRAVSAHASKLPQTLPAAQKILGIAKENGIALTTPDIQAIAEPLLRVKPTDPTLAREVEITLSSLASYKTFSDSKLKPLPRKLIQEAQSTDNYFVNRQIALGERELWSGTIFVDCEIVTGSGSAKLFLKNVSFVNCTFRQVVSPDIAGENLVRAILRSTRPTIDANLYNFSPGDGKQAS